MALKADLLVIYLLDEGLKAALEERSQTMVDGVVGVVISLRALVLSVFSLIDLPVETVPHMLPPLITLLSCSLIYFASVSAR